MDLGAISARAGAPNDGLKKGKDDSERVTAATSEVALWSKQNSDATGMRYQWGRKDPFTFATNSEHWGTAWQRGKYSVKLYNSDNVLIYQEDIGSDNSGKLPSGGALSLNTASSMSVTVANPITFYGGGSLIVINQSGQLGDLYNYYWTSYSRGIDGLAFKGDRKHNDYLDSYIPLRHKSIYDPCPYGYRVPSNGTYNEFNSNPGWSDGNYVGGALWKQSWFIGSGITTTTFYNVGRGGWYSISTPQTNVVGYDMVFSRSGSILLYGGDNHYLAYGFSVRCIEDCDLLPDQTHSSAGY